MDIGINAGFGGTLAHLMPVVRDLGFQWVRQQASPGASVAQMRTLLDEFTAPDAPNLLWMANSIESARVAAEHGSPSAIEMFNEPDLVWKGVEDLSQKPEHYRELLLMAHAEIRQVNKDVPILAGSISNLNDRGLNYLAKTDPKTWPDDVAASFHRYNAVNYPPWVPELARVLLRDGKQISRLLNLVGASKQLATIIEQIVTSVDLSQFIVATEDTTHKNQKGGRFVNRDAEVAALKALTGDRPLYLTEFGFSNAQQDLGIVKFAWTEDETTAMMAKELTFWARHGVRVACVYQLADGNEDADPGERYGVLRYGDMLPSWSALEKPVVKVLKDFVKQAA